MKRVALVTLIAASALFPSIVLAREELDAGGPPVATPRPTPVAVGLQAPTPAPSMEVQGIVGSPSRTLPPTDTD